MHQILTLARAHLSILETAIGLVGILVASFYAWRHITDLKEKKVRLEEENVRLQEENRKLRDKRDATFGNGVNEWLQDHINPMPSICQQLILLASSITYKDATKRLESVKRSISGWGATAPNCAHIARMLDTLSRAAKVDPSTLEGGLWAWRLARTEARKNEHSSLVSSAIESYAALVPHLPEDFESEALRFCDECCRKKGWALQREAARALLPALLGRFPDNDNLLLIYRWLFDEGTEDISAVDQQNLLIEVLNGLRSRADVISQNVSEIWAEALKTAIMDDEQTREPRPVAFNHWRLAIRGRFDAFRRRQEQGLFGALEGSELASLRKEIAGYLENEDAPRHEYTYFELANITHEALKFIVPEAKDKPFRPVARAVVRGAGIGLAITPTTGENIPFEADLINFSLEDGRDHKRGAWAESAHTPPWAVGRPSVPLLVNVKVISPERPTEYVEFKGAQVLESQNLLRGGYGFRVALGRAEAKSGRPDGVGFLEDFHHDKHRYPHR